MIVRIYPENPNPREVERVVEVLRGDGLIVYPTDGVYAVGCALSSRKGAERLQRLRGKSDDELSIVCGSLGMAARYARIDNAQFRILRRNLPGPFTFILDVSGEMPSRTLGRRRTVGVRIPDNGIAAALADALGEPLLSASVKGRGDETEYMTDPELVAEELGREVDLVVDGGPGGTVPTTVVDLTGGEPEVLREGGGELA